MTRKFRPLMIMLCLSFATSPALASEAVKGAKKDIEAIKKEMSVKLEETEKKLSELKEKAARKGDAVQDQAVKDLEATRDRLKAELETAKHEAKTNWTRFKTQMAKSIDDLNEKIQKRLRD